MTSVMTSYFCNLARDKYTGIIAGFLKFILLILSFVYWLIVKSLVLFYRIKPYRPQCRVIGIGNITVGGTGKTTIVEFAARSLRQDGYKVAIVSRGYKRKKGKGAGCDPDYETMGDEPYMLHKRLGDVAVIVDSNRIRAIKRAIKDYAADTVILDDGFQQWGIKKDSEVVAIDATNPFGNRRLLPRGILREPLSSLRRADILVLTKTNINPDVQGIRDVLARINPRAIIFESVHNPLGFYYLGIEEELLNPDALKGKTVTLVSGIGAPDSFQNLVGGMGVNVGLSFTFPDHYDYKQEDLDRIFRASKDKNIDTVLTTEKDAARLSRLRTADSGLRILVLRIELKITKK